MDFYKIYWKLSPYLLRKTLCNSKIYKLVNLSYIKEYFQVHILSKNIINFSGVLILSLVFRQKVFLINLFPKYYFLNELLMKFNHSSQTALNILLTSNILKSAKWINIVFPVFILEYVIQNLYCNGSILDV